MTGIDAYLSYILDTKNPVGQALWRSLHRDFHLTQC